MSDTTPLGDILDSGEAVEQPEVQQEAETPTSERPRDEHGRFARKETGDEPEQQEAEPASVTPAQEERIPIAALKDERQKRQQLEERLRQYDEYFAQLQQQAPPQEEPDMFADPDGFKAHLAQQIRQELLREVQPTLQHQGMMTRAEVSEMLARQKFEDYDATIEYFKEAIEANPFLVQQIQQAPDPATFAYNAGKQWQAAKSFGTEALPSKDDLKAQLREEILAELNLRPTVPTTLADGRSVGARSGPAWAGPKPLGSLLS